MIAEIEGVIAYVSERSPQLGDFLAADAPEFLLTRALLSELEGVQIESPSFTNETVLFTDRGSSLLALTPEGELLGGRSVGDLQSLLVAVRIHEVESFKWVYLPPDRRHALQNDFCIRFGTSSSRVRAMSSLWIEAKCRQALT